MKLSAHFCVWVLLITLRFSPLYGKHFTEGGIFPAPLFLEILSHSLVHAYLELTVFLRLTLNSWQSSCLILLSILITGMSYYYTYLPYILRFPYLWYHYLETMLLAFSLSGDIYIYIGYQTST